MLTPERIKILSNKVNFVKALSAVIPVYQTNVESLHYDVFEDEETGYDYEYLVIDYV